MITGGVLCGIVREALGRPHQEFSVPVLVTSHS